MSHYRTLEVATNASPEVIQVAYRELAKRYQDNPTMLKEINVAKEVLLNDSQRQDYDAGNRPGKGKTIGNYRILSVIAQGGFGTTYKGEHTILGTPVCIKHALRISSDDEYILKEEAKSIWDLRHYGIPSIREIFTMPDGSYALVMSYVPGLTLEQVIKKHHKLDPENVAWISERLLNILKYLHFHGVIHGDVKPQNVIVQEDKHAVVLVDYGLSAIRPKRDSIVKGYTEDFAAPEQLSNKPILPETDFYGLGVTMIYALGGDIRAKSVPSNTPDNLCAFIKSLIRHDVVTRPNWQKEDLIEAFQDIRLKDFGRKASGMKPLGK